MNIVIYLVVCIFFIALLVVGIYNSEDVVIDLILWRVGPLPMGAAIATSVIFGVAFACTIGVIDGIKIRITNRQLRKQLGRMEEDCDALRMQLARREGTAAPADEVSAQPAPWTDSPPSST